MKKLSRIYLAVVLILTAKAAIAQERGYGLVMNPKTFAEIPVMPRQTSGTKSAGRIKQANDLLPYAPTQGDQGKVQSCVSWATSYYAYTIQYAVQHKITDRAEIDKIALSPMYAYKKIVPNCNNGMDIEGVAKYMTVSGNIPYNIFPDAECKATLPQRVQPFVPIKGYQAAFDADSASAEDKIDGVFQAIAFNNIPVIVGMSVGQNFEKLKGTDDYYDPAIDKNTRMQQHAMTVIGYDVRTEAFKILNSWGSNWGNEGCFWIKFEDFAKITSEAIILILPDEAPQAAQKEKSGETIGGSFAFQYWDKESKKYVVTQPSHAGEGVYELDKKDWKVRQAFQLLTNNQNNGLSMCVFSMDEDEKIRLIWPELGDYQMKRTDKLPVANFDMVLPGPDDAIAISKAGTDHLCVLYSNEMLLPDLRVMLRKMENASGDIHDRLRAALGKRLIDPKNVKYEKNRMQFSASVAAGNTVPLILKIQSVPNQ